MLNSHVIITQLRKLVLVVAPVWANFFLGRSRVTLSHARSWDPAALRKRNRMRDCVILMKVVTVLLPLASVLVLVAARKDLVKLQ